MSDNSLAKFFKNMYMNVWHPLDAEAFSRFYDASVIGYSGDTLIRFDDIERHIGNLKQQYQQLNPIIHRTLETGNQLTVWMTQHGIDYQGEEKAQLETMVTYEVVDEKIHRLWFVWNVDATVYFNEETHPKPGERRPEGFSTKVLTRRERDTLYYLIRYFNQKDIARVLDISPRTVEVYINSLKAKFQVTSKRALIEAATKHGFAAPIQKLYELALKQGLIEPL